MLTAVLTGYFTGLSLIVAIGAQNAFVLRQGLTGRHVFPLCLLCATSDALLIAAGVAGFGALSARWPEFPTVMALAGAGFLALYGGLRFRAAWRGDYAMALAGGSAGLGATLAAGAAFTWLNPHVYLDTVGLIGAVSTQFEGGARAAYAMAAIAASFSFFFALGYGARLLAPVMTRPGAWRTLDIGIGLVMWMLAVALLRGAAG